MNRFRQAARRLSKSYTSRGINRTASSNAATAMPKMYPVECAAYATWPPVPESEAYMFQKNCSSRKTRLDISKGVIK